jgi:hypothetical protein
VAKWCEASVLSASWLAKMNTGHFVPVPLLMSGVEMINHNSVESRGIHVDDVAVQVK